MIRLLLRLYPYKWRARYGGELIELIEQVGLGPRTVVDVVRAAARERRSSIGTLLAGGTSMRFGPAWRHPTGWAVAGAAVMAPTAAFVIGSLLAYQFGVGGVVVVMDSTTAWLEAQPRVVDLLLVLAPALALIIAAAPLLRIELRRANGGREAIIGLRLKLLNVAVGAGALAVGLLLLWHIVAEAVLSVGA